MWSNVKAEQPQYLQVHVVDGDALHVDVPAVVLSGRQVVQCASLLRVSQHWTQLSVVRILRIECTHKSCA